MLKRCWVDVAAREPGNTGGEAYHITLEEIFEYGSENQELEFIATPRDWVTLGISHVLPTPASSSPGMPYNCTWHPGHPLTPFFYSDFVVRPRDCCFNLHGKKLSYSLAEWPCQSSFDMRPQCLHEEHRTYDYLLTPAL